MISARRFAAACEAILPICSLSPLAPRPRAQRILHQRFDVCQEGIPQAKHSLLFVNGYIGDLLNRQLRKRIDYAFDPNLVYR